jgi:hypothetical protein
MVGLKRVLLAAPWLAQFARNELSFCEMSRKVGASRRRRYLFLFFDDNSGWSSCSVTVPQAFVEPLGPSTPAKME